MNAMANSQLWHRRLGHFNKRSLEVMQKRDGNGVAFDGSIEHCDVFAVGNSHQRTHPKKAEHAGMTVPFQLVYEDLMGPLKPAARGGYEYVSNITDQFTKWTAVYLLCTKDQALASLSLFVTSTVIPSGSRIVTWRADTGGEYTGKYFQAYCQETGITQKSVATNTPQHIGVSVGVGRTLCAMVGCMHFDSGLPSFLWEEQLMAASHICNRIPHSAFNMKTPYKKLYGKDADPSHFKIVGARAFVRIKNLNRLGHTSWKGMACYFSEIESNSYRTWNLKTCRVVERRNVVFVKTPPNLLPAGLSRRNKISSHRHTMSATTRSTTTSSRAMACCRTSRTTPPLWIPASTRLQEWLNYFYLNKPYSA